MIQPPANRVLAIALVIGSCISILLLSILTILKLIGNLDLGWLWIIGPLWIPGALLGIMINIIVVGLFIYGACIGYRYNKAVNDLGAVLSSKQKSKKQYDG